MTYFNYGEKNIYYEEIGSGVPLILLHGNSVSSKMFSGVINLYKEDFKLILVDFLGHGKSDRLNQFPADLWYEEALQVARLIEFNHYGRVNIIGTSGGALAALNIALEHEELVHKVIADSLEGEIPLSTWTNTLFAERQKTKNQEQVRMLWQYCHGEDWENVVDCDTDAIIQHEKTVKHFFHKDLSMLNVPVLLTASLEDDELKDIINIEKTYHTLQRKIPNGKMHLFATGGHPAMLTNAIEFASMARMFFED